MWYAAGYEAESLDKLACDIASHCSDNDYSLPDFDDLYCEDEWGFGKEPTKKMYEYFSSKCEEEFNESEERYLSAAEIAEERNWEWRASRL